MGSHSASFPAQFPTASSEPEEPYRYSGVRRYSEHDEDPYYEEGRDDDPDPENISSAPAPTPVATTPRPGRGRPRKAPATTGQLVQSVPTRRSTPRSSLTAAASTSASSGGIITGLDGQDVMLVYKCPVIQCERFYATKLALKRHFQVYQHEALYDGPLESILVLGENQSSSEENSLIRKILPKLYKCPVLSCLERFNTENELVSHWKHGHQMIKSNLAEWTNLFYEFDNVGLTPVEHPAVYIKEEAEGGARGDWQFHSIFQVLGPQPSLKLGQLIAQLRTRLASALPLATLQVDESFFGLVLQLVLYELMPRAYLLTRDPDPARVASVSEYDVWKDEPWLRNVDAESAHILLHYGSAHTSRNYKRKSLPDSVEVMDAQCEDRFVCQVPGCAKVFASLPAYKYHMHHYEHDLEILIRASRLLRKVLFAPLPADESSEPLVAPDRWVLRFGGPSPHSMYDRLLCLPDVVHILHGYIDQQLPLLFSWHFMKKRGLVSFHPSTQEFILTLKREEDPDTVRHEIMDVLAERKSRESRKRRREEGQEMPRRVAPSAGLLSPSALPGLRALATSPGGPTPPPVGLSNDDSDSVKRPLLGLLSRFVLPTLLVSYQRNRFVVSGDPGDMSALHTQLHVYRSISSVSEDEIFVLSQFYSAGTRPVSLHVRNDTGLVAKSFAMQPFTAVLLDGNAGKATNAGLYGDGEMISGIEWFPLVFSVGDNTQVAFLAVGGSSSTVDYPFVFTNEGVGGDVRARANVHLWAVVLHYEIGSNSYRLGMPKMVASFKSSTPVFDEHGESSGGGISNGVLSIVSLRFYPFVVAGLGDPGDTELRPVDSGGRSLLAVLYASGEISIYSLPISSVFPQGLLGADYEPKLVGVKEVCRLQIPSYTITCMSWCRVAGMPVRLVVGTNEGYIAIFDLSVPTSPSCILMNPGHPTTIASIEWSFTDAFRVVTASFDNTVMLWQLNDMYQRAMLLQSRQPFFSAQWLHSCMKVGGADLGFGKGDSGIWDPVGAVIAVDESNLAKIVLMNEPGRVITLASTAPRMWVSVYPNSRFGGTLLAMANWHGKVEVFGTPDPRSKKGDSANIALWTYDHAMHTYSVLLPPASDLDVSPDASNIEKDAMGIVQIAWHPVPVGLFAVASATGLIHVHCS